MILRKTFDSLLPVENLPRVQGIDVPESFYLVTREPVFLAGMKYPDTGTPWRGLHQLGFHYIVSLTENKPDYDPAPLEQAGHYPLQDLYRQCFPGNPMEEWDRIDRATRCVMELTKRQAGIIIHCEGGTGRTGTIIGCVLKCLGYNSRRVIAYLDDLNRLRGTRRGWPESLWQAEVVQRYPRSLTGKNH